MPNVIARSFKPFQAAVGLSIVSFNIDPDFRRLAIVGDMNCSHADETNSWISKFALDEKSASVAAPKGVAKLKGAVCSGATCKPFEKDVTVN